MTEENRLYHVVIYGLAFYDKDSLVSSRLGFSYVINDLYALKDISVIRDEIISRLVSKYKDDGLHHIIVSELPIDREVNGEPFLSEYTYLSDGSLYIEKRYNALGLKGRKDDNIPLKVGDEVLFVDQDEYRQDGVIRFLPPVEGVRDGVDFSNDCYVVETKDFVDTDEYEYPLINLTFLKVKGYNGGSNCLIIKGEHNAEE
jgi:hypothetical protein